MALTDEQLMLLEQLTYLDNDVANEASPKNEDGSVDGKHRVRLNTEAKTVEDLIKPFMNDPDALKTLQNSKKSSISGGVMQGNEWAAIIRAVNEDEELKKLQISVNYTGSKNNKIDNIIFTEKDGDPNQAIVAFRGTLDGREWNDNFEGFNRADTQCNKEALRFINGLPYNDITVVGHSKGGMKAQYCTRLCDKIIRCLSMDGAGSCIEYRDKYWAEIQERGHLIRNVSLGNDFVHEILFPITNSTQDYFQGSGMANAAENHSPCSYFQFTYNDAGEAVLVFNEKTNQVDLITLKDEDDAIKYIRNFLYFAENLMTDEQKQETVDLLGPIAGMTIGGGVEIDGVWYDKDDVNAFLESHQKEEAVFLGYLLKYCYTYDLTDENIAGMLKSFGLDKWADTLEEFAEKYPALYKLAGGSIRSIIGQLGDGKDDKIIELILEKLEELLKDKGINIDLVALWQEAEKVYSDIEVKDQNAAIAVPDLREGKRYNYSWDAYDEILEKIRNFQNSLFTAVDWTGYQDEKWYGSFLISLTMKGINSYIDGVSNQMETAKIRIKTTFADIWEIDDTGAKTIDLLSDDIVDMTQNYVTLSERIK